MIKGILLSGGGQGDCVMKYSKVFVLCWFGISLLFGCSPAKNVVVLLPEPGGTVGEVQIRNDGGEQTLSEAGQAVYIKNQNTAPASPVSMEETDIQELFKEVLEIEPRVPQTYILYFNKGTTRLSDDSVALLSDILKIIESRKPQDIHVIGHTDRAGDKQFNLKLSLKRAMVVRDRLIAEGVPPTAIETTSYGEAIPLIPTKDNTSEPLNRRVEIIIR